MCARSLAARLGCGVALAALVSLALQGVDSLNLQHGSPNNNQLKNLVDCNMDKLKGLAVAGGLSCALVLGAAPAEAASAPKTFSASTSRASTRAVFSEAKREVKREAASAKKTFSFFMSEVARESVEGQSRGWELARQKRTAAVKVMAEKGIVRVETDDSGNQFLSLPWIPDQRVTYKRLGLRERLTNEVCAGAFGEISKDVLLYSVDTIKTRRQVAKKKAVLGLGQKQEQGQEQGQEQEQEQGQEQGQATWGVQDGGGNSTVSDGMYVVAMSESQSGAIAANAGVALSMQSVAEMVGQFPGLYAGFPIVALSSIPQGGVFFLVKKSLVEFFSVNYPQLPEAVSSSVPIVVGVMVYWLFRTPSEVIKTQVQTAQLPSVAAALEDAQKNNPNGLLGLWSRYPVMLSLDIPFQLISFILYGVATDAVVHAGYEQTLVTRLVVGIICGMISAAVTCPLDVAKTRIVAREKEMQMIAATGVLTTPEAVREADLADISEYIAATPAERDRADRAEGRGMSAYRTEGVEFGGGEGVALLEPDTSTLAGMGSDSGMSAYSRVDDEVLEDLSAGMQQRVTGMKTNNVVAEMIAIAANEGPTALLLGFQQRLLYTGLANGIRLAAYGTSRMDLMMRSLDNV